MSKLAESFFRPNPFEPDPAELGAPEEKPRHWRIQLVEDTHAAAKARDENVCPMCNRPLGSYGSRGRVNPASNLLYTARLCPVGRFNKVFAIRGGELWERFDRSTFFGQAKRPEEVIVDREHEERELGRLTRLYLADGWWTCRFRMHDPVAEHFAAIGTPVSISFSPIRSQDRAHEIATLHAVSLCEGGAYDGAEITAVIDLDTFDPYESFAMDADLAAKLRSNGISVPAPRPEPAPASDERDRFAAEPWVIAAQKAAVPRTLIRNCGRVLAVR